MKDIGGVESVVVVGGGQGALQAVQSLRQGGYTGPLTLVGSEPILPYQRPPLSKAFMKGELDEERLYFRPMSWFEENSIRFVPGKAAVSMSREQQRVVLNDGEALAYDALVLATGARPRMLCVEGASCDNVFALRAMSDAERLRPEMLAGRRLLVIGAGYIGLEVAAIARQMQLDVTVIEAAPRILARVTSVSMSDFYAAYHRAKGVEIITNARLARLEVTAGRVTGAVLEDGRGVPADLVLSGIGVVPNIELAEAAGLICDNGILVDEDSRTNDARIFAVGDCASRPLVHYGGRYQRLESVHNAIEQGKLAAAAILGAPRPREECPWFWSDQYDLKLQTAGLQDGFDEIVSRGRLEDRKFALFYFREGRLLAVDAVNSPPEFMMAKKWIPQRTRLDRTLLADAAVPLRDVAACVVEA